VAWVKLEAIVAANIRDRLVVTKNKTRISYGNVQIQKLNEVEGKEQHHFEISDKFAALEN
jgi:hypothetical protein